MAISPRNPQTRLPLHRALAEHDQRCAGTLVNLQIYPTVLEAAVTVGLGEIPRDIDVIKGDTTDGAFNATLPLGDQEIVGHIYEAIKVAGAAAFGFALQGDDTFEDAATTFTNATTDASVRTYWDGEVWRKISGATGGALPAASSGTLGDGTGSPTLTMNKSATGTDKINLQAASVLRGQLQLNATEDVVLSVYDTDGTTLLGTITLDNTGAVTTSKGITITTGGLLVSAGGARVVAGGMRVDAGGLQVVAGPVALPLTNYANNAAAITGGLSAGQLYQTAGAVMVVT